MIVEIEKESKLKEEVREENVGGKEVEVGVGV